MKEGELGATQSDLEVFVYVVMYQKSSKTVHEFIQYIKKERNCFIP